MLVPVHFIILPIMWRLPANVELFKERKKHGNQPRMLYCSYISVMFVYTGFSNAFKLFFFFFFQIKESSVMHKNPWLFVSLQP